MFPGLTRAKICIIRERPVNVGLGMLQMSGSRCGRLRMALSLQDEPDKFVKFNGQNDCKAKIENELVRVFRKVHGLAL